VALSKHGSVTVEDIWSLSCYADWFIRPFFYGRMALYVPDSGND